MIKLQINHESQYRNVLDGVSNRVLEAISANRMTPFQVLLRYSDNCVPGEDFITWLETVEYPEIKHLTADEPLIPEYQTVFDVERIFEGSPRVDGFVDDSYLESLGELALKLANN